MLWLKTCPRCHGDLTEGQDLYGPFIACIQCGHYLPEWQERLLRRGLLPQPASVAVPVRVRTNVR